VSLSGVGEKGFYPNREAAMLASDDAEQHEAAKLTPTE
jgi:hypothetical protein